MGKNIFKGVDIYTKRYDYEDIKVAIVVAERLDKINAHWDYEDIVRYAIHIKNEWKKQEKQGKLSTEEYCYIQAFANRYLDELDNLIEGVR